MKKLLLFSFYCVFIASVQAQTLVSPAAGRATTTSGTVYSWSMGELATLTLQSGNSTLTQGQQQPIANQPTELEIFNGLTTNDNNATNNTFIIKGIQQFPDNRLIIVNRWSETLFVGEPYTNNWGGTDNNGTFVETGTYYYVFYPNKAEKKHYKGTILIVRH
jgi:gliding motility-associated-like protein